MIFINLNSIIKVFVFLYASVGYGLSKAVRPLDSGFMVFMEFGGLIEGMR